MIRRTNFTHLKFASRVLVKIIYFLLSPSDMTHLSLHDHDGSSGGASDQDTLPPLPHPGAAPWPMALPYQFPIPHPYELPQPFHGGPGAGSAGSQHSGECKEYYCLVCSFLGSGKLEFMSLTADFGVEINLKKLARCPLRRLQWLQICFPLHPFECCKHYVALNVANTKFSPKQI